MARKGDGGSGGRHAPFLSIPFFLSQLKNQIRTCSNSSETNRVNVRDPFGPASARLKSSSLAFYWLSCLQKLLFIFFFLPTTAKPKPLQLLSLMKDNQVDGVWTPLPMDRIANSYHLPLGKPMGEDEAAQNCRTPEILLEITVRRTWLYNSKAETA